MNSKDYNSYLSAIKTAEDIKDRDERKKILASIKTRIIADYGLNDSDAKYLVRKCE